MACTVGERLRGLLGREEFEGALLLVPCNDVHTFGMKRSIDLAFVASDGTVVESYRNVSRRKRLRCRRARAVIERFSDEAPWFRQGDRIQLRHLAWGEFYCE